MSETAHHDRRGGDQAAHAIIRQSTSLAREQREQWDKDFEAAMKMPDGEQRRIALRCLRVRAEQLKQNQGVLTRMMQAATEHAKQ